MLREERGASAIIISMSLLLLIGIAAIAIDLSNGFNERRQDQTAADVGVMAGAIETLGSADQIRDQILDFSRRNVVATYTDDEWQTHWEDCVDNELPLSGFNFVPVSLPAGWTQTNPGPWCISLDGGGFVRVRLPNLEFDTTFARVIGFNELETSADAIARITNRGGGGILPFGLLADAGDGQHICLRDSSGGHAEEPCDGPDAGNFGAIESPWYGTQPDGPPRNCTGSPKKDILAVNIARGIDHRVVKDLDPSPANEVQDTCGNMDAGLIPDTLNTFQGLSNGLVEGLVTGPVPHGYTPRLQQGTNPKQFVYGTNIDNKPLWEYIDPSLSAAGGDDIPADCERGKFNNSDPDFDWDGDGTLDRPESWQHLSFCLQAYSSGGHTGILFMENLNESPRFAYVPKFHEDTWPAGNGWRHIEHFKASWLQATWWKKGADVNVHHPGEGGTFTMGGSWKLIQLSGIVIPDAALPEALRGDAGVGGVDPYETELFR